MKRITGFFRTSATHVFLFCLFFVFLNWPFITIQEADVSGIGVWTFLFLTMSLLVIFSCLVSRSLRGVMKQEEADSTKKGEMEHD